VSNQDEPIVIELQQPVTYTDKFEGTEHTITELRLPRRIKARMLAAADGESGQVGQTLALISAATGLPRKAIDELDAADVARIGETWAPLDERPTTGPTSSA